MSPVGDLDGVFLGDDPSAIACGSVEGVVLRVPSWSCTISIALDSKRAVRGSRPANASGRSTVVGSARSGLGDRADLPHRSPLRDELRPGRRFARRFDRPVGWFVLPPEGHVGEMFVQPNADAAPAGMGAAERVTLAVGSDTGQVSRRPRWSIRR